MSDDATCPYHDLAAEFALGMLPGPERAAVLEHLPACDECSARVTAFTAVGDGLLALIPGTEPPLGFEERTMHRLGFAPRPKARPKARPKLRPKPRRIRLPKAAVAAATAMAFGFAGWTLGSTTHHTPTSVTSQAATLSAPLLTPNRQTVGRVFLYSNGSPWLYMAITRAPGADGTLYCQVQHRDGSVAVVGSIQVKNGSGWWDAPAPSSATAITGASLLTPTGTVVATSRF